jgi:hypothetical protein
MDVSDGLCCASVAASVCTHEAEVVVGARVKSGRGEGWKEGGSEVGQAKSGDGVTYGRVNTELFTLRSERPEVPGTVGMRPAIEGRSRRLSIACSMNKL